MIPEGTDSHILDSKADAENEDYKYQAKALSAIKKGLEICCQEALKDNERQEAELCRLEMIWETERGMNNKLKKENKEWKEECDRLAGLVKFWQEKYYELNPPHQNPKIDNSPIA